MIGERPLAGIAIAEIGGEVATRYCARLFAVLGADVWRAGDDKGVSAEYAAWLDQGKHAVATPEAALAALDVTILSLFGPVDRTPAMDAKFRVTPDGQVTQLPVK